jgi:hypothetical protein
MTKGCVWCHPSNIRPVVKGRDACNECADRIEAWIDEFIAQAREEDA